MHGMRINRLPADAGPNVNSPGAFRAVYFMAGDGKGVDSRLIRINRQFAETLNTIAMKKNVSLMEKSGQTLHRLDEAGF